MELISPTNYTAGSAIYLKRNRLFGQATDHFLATTVYFTLFRK
ncbi:hypothetical protein BN8_06619 [Fibrisoma limi BUZ 3]|uniref:Uncharacterized protein n=1 Tax=Fibrisoma limi BUZ 3 TaxID=1185876 RepID=I2GTI4_9BACT|nr:hypothetical protein BN8_06619 [Fibrisoma limi BUZ 3]